LRGTRWNPRASPRGAFYLTYRAGKGRAAQKKRLHLGPYPKITAEQARALAKEKAAAVVRGEDPAAEVQTDKQAVIMSASEAGLFQHVAPSLSDIYRTTQRYAHLEENPARKAAEEAAAKIAKAMSKKNSGKIINFADSGKTEIV